jgi:uncharacterized protein YkwD
MADAAVVVPSAGEAAAPAAAAVLPKGTDPEIAAAFELQNRLRARHGVAPLAWDAGLAASGAKYVAGCPMDHSSEWSDRGESLAWMFPKFVDAVKAWYDEVRARGTRAGAALALWLGQPLAETKRAGAGALLLGAAC